MESHVLNKDEKKGGAESKFDETTKAKGEMFTVPTDDAVSADVCTDGYELEELAECNPTNLMFTMDDENDNTFEYNLRPTLTDAIGGFESDDERETSSTSSSDSDRTLPAPDHLQPPSPVDWSPEGETFGECAINTEDSWYPVKSKLMDFGEEPPGSNDLYQPWRDKSNTLLTQKFDSMYELRLAKQNYLLVEEILSQSIVELEYLFNGLASMRICAPAREALNLKKCFQVLASPSETEVLGKPFPAATADLVRLKKTSSQTELKPPSNSHLGGEFSSHKIKSIVREYSISDDADGEGNLYEDDFFYFTPETNVFHLYDDAFSVWKNSLKRNELPEGIKSDGADVGKSEESIKDRTGRSCPSSLNVSHFSIESIEDMSGDEYVNVDPKHADHYINFINSDPNESLIVAPRTDDDDFEENLTVGVEGNNKEKVVNAPTPTDFTSEDNGLLEVNTERVEWEERAVVGAQKLEDRCDQSISNETCKWNSYASAGSTKTATGKMMLNDEMTVKISTSHEIHPIPFSYYDRDITSFGKSTSSIYLDEDEYGDVTTCHSSSELGRFRMTDEALALSDMFLQQVINEQVEDMARGILYASEGNIFDEESNSDNDYDLQMTSSDQDVGHKEEREILSSVRSLPMTTRELLFNRASEDSESFEFISQYKSNEMLKTKEDFHANIEEEATPVDTPDVSDEVVLTNFRFLKDEFFLGSTLLPEENEILSLLKKFTSLDTHGSQLSLDLTSTTDGQTLSSGTLNASDEMSDTNLVDGSLSETNSTDSGTNDTDVNVTGDAADELSIYMNEYSDLINETLLKLYNDDDEYSLSVDDEYSTGESKTSALDSNEKFGNLDMKACEELVNTEVVKYTSVAEEKVKEFVESNYISTRNQKKELVVINENVVHVNDSSKAEEDVQTISKDLRERVITKTFSVRSPSCFAPSDEVLLLPLGTETVPEFFEASSEDTDREKLVSEALDGLPEDAIRLKKVVSYLKADEVVNGSAPPKGRPDSFGLKENFNAYVSDCMKSSDEYLACYSLNSTRRRKEKKVIAKTVPFEGNQSLESVTQATGKNDEDFTRKTSYIITTEETEQISQVLSIRWRGHETEGSAYGDLTIDPKAAENENFIQEIADLKGIDGEIPRPVGQTDPAYFVQEIDDVADDQAILDNALNLLNPLNLQLTAEHPPGMADVAERTNQVGSFFIQKMAFAAATNLNNQTQNAVNRGLVQNHSQVNSSIRELDAYNLLGFRNSKVIAQRNVLAQYPLKRRCLNVIKESSEENELRLEEGKSKIEENFSEEDFMFSAPAAAAAAAAALSMKRRAEAEDPPDTDEIAALEAEEFFSCESILDVVSTDDEEVQRRQEELNYVANAAYGLASGNNFSRVLSTSSESLLEYYSAETLPLGGWENIDRIDPAVPFRVVPPISSSGVVAVGGKAKKISSLRRIAQLALWKTKQQNADVVRTTLCSNEVFSEDRMFMCNECTKNKAFVVDVQKTREFISDPTLSSGKAPYKFLRRKRGIDVDMSSSVQLIAFENLMMHRHTNMDQGLSQIDNVQFDFDTWRLDAVTHAIHLTMLILVFAMFDTAMSLYLSLSRN